MANLTVAQIQTLRTDILAKVAASVFTGNDHGAVVNYYNAGSGSNLWRPRIEITELNTAIVWSEFAALSQGLRDSYMALTQAGFVDTTSANVRAGFNSIFAGASQTNLIALAKREGSRFEMLFSGAAVSGASVCAIFGGICHHTNVEAALGLGG